MQHESPAAETGAAQTKYHNQLNQINRDGKRLARLIYWLTSFTLIALVGLTVIYGPGPALYTLLAINGGLFFAVFFKQKEFIANCQQYLVNHTHVERQLVYDLAEELKVDKGLVDDLIYPMPVFKNAVRVIELHENPPLAKDQQVEAGPFQRQYEKTLRELSVKADSLTGLTFMLLGLLMALVTLGMRTFGGGGPVGAALLGVFLFTLASLYLKRQAFFLRSRAFLASRYETANTTFSDMLASEVGVSSDYARSIKSMPPVFLDAMVVMQEHKKLIQQQALASRY